jgi:2-methylcitrate dehydratase PrpD
LLHLDEAKMAAAIGLAAAQASGFRGTHGAMSAFAVPAHAARCGVTAAMLAARGFSSMDNILEAPKGFVDVFGSGGDLDRAVDGLGEHFELFANAYKPYPSGIVVQAAIDTCLEIANQLPADAALANVALTVHPLALELCGRREPATPVEAQISLFHWAAATLVQRSAGLAQLRQDCIDDPAVAALRARISAAADPGLGRDEAIAEVTLTSGATLRSHVKHARGSIGRPMTDDELNAKFEAQAREVLASGATEKLLRLCRNVSRLDDVGNEVAAIWKTHIDSKAAAFAIEN